MPKFAGFSIGPTGFTAHFDVGPNDAETARRVIRFLDNRRVLFGERHSEDELACVRSAIEIRNYLTEELSHAKPEGFLDSCLFETRRAFTRFVDAAGYNASNFVGGYPDNRHFWIALGELRALVGQVLGVLSERYDIDVGPDLASIIPATPPHDGHDHPRHTQR